MALRRLFNFLAGAQQGGKKKKLTEEERGPQEHTAHFFPEAHVDEDTTEEPEKEYSEEEPLNASEVHGVDEATTKELENETYSKEEVVNCSTAETSEYTIIRILKSLVNIRFRSSPEGESWRIFSQALSSKATEMRWNRVAYSYFLLLSSIANNFCLFPSFFRVSQAGIFLQPFKTPVRAVQGKSLGLRDLRKLTCLGVQRKAEMSFPVLKPVYRHVCICPSLISFCCNRS